MNFNIKQRLFIIYLGLLTVLIMMACQAEPETVTTLFERLDSQQTNITFNNEIIENDSLNVLDYEYIYNGGGVAIADFNNDGWQDVFFTGNMVANAMYLNKGNFQFQDITLISGTAAPNSWSSGVATVDINADGWMDLYICTNTHKQGERRQNLLFVNQGLNAEGLPVFENRASEYGLADTTYAMNAAFFDYDNDNDLDVFIIVNEMEGSRYPSKYRKKRSEKRFRKDKLYRNDWNEKLGHPVFTDVSLEAGINIEGYSLGLNIVDINEDGWKDVYVTNDFISDDLFYINNGDGTFTNKSNDFFKHTSHSAMGNDVVDINNDGLMDVIALDMLPEDNYRRKTMMGANSYTSYINNERYGYSYQFVRNTLQVNQGMNPYTKTPVFSEVSMMAGIAATDWSWTPLVADFNNDSFQDIIITNGFPKDVTDRDFMDFQANNYAYAPKEMMLKQIPEVKLYNYAYQNKGGIAFEDVSKAWGIDVKSFSNGAAYVDLDNDGDLDYIVNNIDDKAFVYRNNYEEQHLDSTHYLRIQLQGKQPNTSALGAVVEVFSNEQSYKKEFSPYRGYLSSVEPFLHFGLGTDAKVDSVVVTWTNGTRSQLMDIPIDTVLSIQENQNTIVAKNRPNQVNPFTWLTQADTTKSIAFQQEEADFIDFNVQPLLPHKLSQYGPGLAVGDINNDGRSDIYATGSHRYAGQLYIQQRNGTFKPQSIVNHPKRPEELSAVFFDADADGDQDLYIVHGSYEYNLTDSIYQDRFYRNDNGQLIYDKDALPNFLSSGSCVRVIDMDKDGDLDIFIGGRVHPHQYPKPVDSYLLLNESNGKDIQFQIANSSHAPDLQGLGMVTDALWTDTDNDNWMDLLVVGEYMDITLFKNQSGILKKVGQTGLENQKGWWNSLTAGDFDHDGDTDYIAGNLGSNTLFPVQTNTPVKAYGNDFDKNGGYDLILTAHLKNNIDNPTTTEFPFHDWKSVMSQMIYVRDSFKTYKAFADARVETLFPKTEMLENAIILDLNYPYTSLIENKGNGQFELRPLPMEAQIAPVFGMQTIDLDEDGHLDLLLVGNDFGMELTTGKCDALNGLVLKGNGQLGFEAVSLANSGFVVPGDAKSLIQYTNGTTWNVLAGQNKATVKHYQKILKGQIVSFKPKDIYAIVQDTAGEKYKVEAYYGNGFLSQSERFFVLPKGHKLIEVVTIDE